ncbi:MAG: S-methyl-5-thioribose-1-phosphate isomerase [Ignavibacteriaceae bacterium]|nr:S-methyl-5-thioribose-1-phosphate isomerase [Ignavibacteriaceae bacterium]
MKNNNYFSLKFENDNLIFLNQTLLPLKEEYISTDDYNRIAEAIEKLEIRGAPAIGIAAAYGLALSLKNSSQSEFENDFYLAFDRLSRTRPTAVNLFSALNEMKAVFLKNSDNPFLYKLLIQRAAEIHEQDIDYCERIGNNGLRIFKKKSNVLTHCNTGLLATGGNGTAFNIIRKAFNNGLLEKVYADETRPLLQGLRLTAFELMKEKIPFEVLCDNSAAFLMQKKLVDLVITGADRIALNGDTANKIGTYNLAVLCTYHEIPFYIAAPSTTIDREIISGDEIVIEFRNKMEILKINNHQIAPEETETYSPAFDITPSHLITGIITEEDIFSFPYNFLR